MTREEIHAQREMDKEIAFYVREMESTAPIGAESVHAYLSQTRRRRVTPQAVKDRLAYLVSRGFLAARKEWEPGVGETLYYTATADGRDALDGAIPWEK